MRAQFYRRRAYCRGRAIVSILAGLLALIAAPMAAMAEKRHAFVVGINVYDKLPAHHQLKKAVGDARAMGETLTSLGFAVTPLYDVKRGELVERWSQFLEQVSPGDTVAVVFSGHGIELEGANYLLPRDVPRVRTGRESQLRNESLSFGQMMTDLRERRPAFAFVVLDACRDNPFEEGGKTVGGKRGLGQVEPLEGTFVMFSAGAGQTALDRLGDSDTAATSIFTRTLVPLMRKPGLSLLEMADQVGEQVRDLASTIGHRQTPAFYSRVIGGRRVCLAGCEVAAVGKPDPRPPVAAGPSAVETVQVCREVEQLTSMRTLEALERSHAGTPIADCISARMGELKSAQTAALMRQQEERSSAEQAAEDERRRRAAEQFTKERRDKAAAEDEKRAEEAKRKADADKAKAEDATKLAEISLRRDLQAELKRVGCYSGDVDGDWGDLSTDALARFSRETKSSGTLTLATLEAVKNSKTGVCPLICSDGERLLDGKCVPKATGPKPPVECDDNEKLINGTCVATPSPKCKAGQTLRDGKCVTIQRPPPEQGSGGSARVERCGNWIPNGTTCRDNSGRVCTMIGSTKFCN